jgi:carboxymethylenebutenolidase
MGERTAFRCNGSMTDGYLARPATGRGPGLVVIQEWWGLVPQIERVADRFAGEGFVALAPDLYHGQSTKSPDEAGKLMMALRSEDAARDLAAAIDHLVEQPEASTRKVGTIGFCMGGALSLFAASRNPEVGACVVFYGGHPNIKPDLASLSAPVLGIYAGRDTFVSPAVVAALDKELTALGKRHEFHTFADAQHGFFNETRPEVYDAAAAKDAWAKTLAFFRQELRA